MGLAHASSLLKLVSHPTGSWIPGNPISSNKLSKCDSFLAWASLAHVVGFFFFLLIVWILGWMGGLQQ